MKYKDSVDVLEVVKKRDDFSEGNFQDLISQSYSEIVDYFNKTLGEEREINEMYSSNIEKRDGKFFTRYSGVFSFLHPEGVVVGAEVEYTDDYPPDLENYIFKKVKFNLFSDTTPIDSFKRDLEKIILEWKQVPHKNNCCIETSQEKIIRNLNNVYVDFYFH